MNMAFEQGLEKKKEGVALIRGEALIRDYTVIYKMKKRLQQLLEV